MCKWTPQLNQNEPRIYWVYVRVPPPTYLGYELTGPCGRRAGLWVVLPFIDLDAEALQTSTGSDQVWPVIIGFEAENVVMLTYQEELVSSSTTDTKFKMGIHLKNLQSNWLCLLWAHYSAHSLCANSNPILAGVPKAEHADSSQETHNLVHPYWR